MAWRAASRGGREASFSIRAPRASGSCPPSATASSSSAAISCASRPAAGAAGAIPSPGIPSACARMWRGGSSPPAGRARTTASCSTPPRSRSTRRRATRSAGAARASYPSSTGVPASTRQKRAGGPASHDHPRCKETLMRDLVTRMNALCDALPFQTSWYLKDLATGTVADRLGDVPVPSASTRKISIMMAALSAVHDGKLSLDQKVTIEAKYQDNDSGTFQHLTPGFWITFRDALVMMIIVSDNTCTGTVADLVGLPAIQRYCESVGLTGTIHRFGIPPKVGRDHTLEQVTTTTPNDQGLLLELILQGTTDAAVAGRLGGTPELCRLGLDILSWQKLKARLPSRLPLGTKAAHKTGTGSRGFMDAGVIYKGDRPLLI